MEIDPLASDYVHVYGPGYGEPEFRPLELFEKYCDFCDTANGRIITKQGSFARATTHHPFLACSYLGAIYSEEFLNLLSEFASLDFVDIPVRICGSEKKYLELVGPVISESVIIDDFPGLNGFRCPRCKTAVFSYFTNYTFYIFLNKNNLPKYIPLCFLIKNSRRIDLIIRRDIWNLISKNSIAGNLISQPVLIVDDRRVNKSPDLFIITRKRRKVK